MPVEIDALDCQQSGMIVIERGDRRRAMTHQEAKLIARHLGLTLRKVRSADYRVNFPNADDSAAYYTDNLEDTINRRSGDGPKAHIICRRREKRFAAAGGLNGSSMCGFRVTPISRSEE